MPKGRRSWERDWRSFRPYCCRAFPRVTLREREQDSNEARTRRGQHPAVARSPSSAYRDDASNLSARFEHPLCRNESRRLARTSSAEGDVAPAFVLSKRTGVLESRPARTIAGNTSSATAMKRTTPGAQFLDFFMWPPVTSIPWARAGGDPPARARLHSSRDRKRDRGDLSADLAGRVPRRVDVHVGAPRLQRPQHCRRQVGSPACAVSAGATERHRNGAGSPLWPDVDVRCGSSAGQAREPQTPDDGAGRPRLRHRPREGPARALDVALRLRPFLATLRLVVTAAVTLSWPRISPGPFAAVWRFTYALPDSIASSSPP